VESSSRATATGAPSKNKWLNGRKKGLSVASNSKKTRLPFFTPSTGSRRVLVPVRKASPIVMSVGAAWLRRAEASGGRCQARLEETWTVSSNGNQPVPISSVFTLSAWTTRCRRIANVPSGRTE
jgi:hypothetical protein